MMLLEYLKVPAESIPRKAKTEIGFVHDSGTLIFILPNAVAVSKQRFGFGSSNRQIPPITPFSGHLAWAQS
jgi:hypothetical protein